MILSADRRTSPEPHMLHRDAGVIDLWWPFHPMPRGSKYTIKVTGEQTQGRLMQMLVTDRRGAAPPLHIHHQEDETFYVLDGEMAIFVGDERFDCRPGDFVFGPKGVPHAFLVRSEKAQFLVTFTPAGIEDFFREVAVPVVPGEPAPDPVAPDIDEWVHKMAARAIEFVGPPPSLD